MHHAPFRAAPLRSILAALTLVVGLSACSPGEASPGIADDDVVDDAVPPVHRLSATPAGTWGLGRAIRVSKEAGTTVVVSTTGVYVTADADAGPNQLEAFGLPVEVGPIAMSRDGTTLAVGIVTPPSVRVYDLPAATIRATHDLPTEASLRSISFDDAHALVIDTSIGPYRSPNALPPLEPPVDSASHGMTAVVPGGIVTPISGTADLVLRTAEGPQRQQLATADGATVLDARSSPTASVVAVTMGVGADLFEREDRIVVLDAATLTQMSVVEVGRVLDPLEWTVTDEAVVVSDGARLSVWALDGTALANDVATPSPVASIHPVADGIVTAHADGSLLRWESGSWNWSVIDPGGIILTDVAVAQGGAAVVTVDHFGTVTEWPLSGGWPIRTIEHFAVGEATDVSVSIDGTQIGVSSTAGRVHLLNTALEEQWAFQPSGYGTLVDAVSFDPARGTLATGLAERLSETSFDDTVTVWDTVHRSSRFSVGGEAEDVSGCSFFYGRVRYSADGTHMAVTSHDFSVLVLDVATGAVLHELPGTTTILDLEYTPDDDLLVATYDDGSVNVWNTSDYSLAASYRGAAGGYHAIEILPDSATMAVIDITGGISLVDLMTGEALRSFAGAAYRTATMALTRDGSLLAAPTTNGEIAVWSTFSGETLTRLTGHTGEVTGLAFAPGDDWLASSSADGTVRTWSFTRVE